MEGNGEDMREGIGGKGSEMHGVWYDVHATHTRCSVTSSIYNIISHLMGKAGMPKKPPPPNAN